MKKISLLILMLTFLLIPTCVNANDISYADFESKVNEATGLNITTVLNNANQYNNFISDFNSCVYFSVFSDFGFASTSPDTATNKYIYFICNKSSKPLSFVLSTSPWEYSLNTNNYSNIYTVDINTGSVSRATFTERNLFKYNINDQNNWSETKFISKTGMEFFLDTAYIMSWNTPINCQYKPNGNSQESTTTELIQLSSLDASDFPWEGGNAGGTGSGDTYYNYDFIGPNPQPYLKVFNTNGYMGDGSGDGIFGLYTYISDKKYPINILKLDLEVYEISESYQLKLVNTYKNYNGRLLNANGTYQTVSSGESLVVYTYNMVNAFGADFLSQYLDDVKNYAFTIKLYDINDNLLSKVDLLYFGVDNTLNYYPSLDDYYNPPYNNNGYGDINLNTDFSDLVDIFLSFMSTVMGFLSIFPLWMTTLIGMGITVAIILRIGGR